MTMYPTNPPGRAGYELVMRTVVENAHLDAELRHRLAVRQQCLENIETLQRRFHRALTLPPAQATLAHAEFTAVRDALRATMMQYAARMGWSEADVQQLFQSPS